MTLRYSLERTNASGDWDVMVVAPNRPNPAALGLVGSATGLARVRCEDQVVEVWRWSEHIPLNPADPSCQQFIEGWKLVERRAAPAPRLDELRDFFPVE